MNRPAFADVERILRGNAPHRYSLLPGPRPLDLLVDPKHFGLALLVPCDAKLEFASVALAAVQYGWYEVDGRRCLSVSVPDIRLAQYSLGFLLALADELRDPDAPILPAIKAAIRSWRALLAHPDGLTAAEAIGLWGELWFVRELLRHIGARAIDAWLGPEGEVHDFRLPGKSLEVKTTTSASRVHTIHGLGQLSASPGLALFLVSLHLEPSGAAEGDSLMDLWDSVVATIGPTDARVEQLHRVLKKCGADEARLASADRKYRHRDEPRLIAVDQSLPALTRSLLNGVLSEAAVRLGDVTYEIDVTGLGQPLDMRQISGASDDG